MSDEYDSRNELVLSSPYTPDGSRSPAHQRIMYVPNLQEGHTYATLDDLLEAWLYLEEILDPRCNLSISYEDLYQTSVSEASEDNTETFDRDDLARHKQEIDECLSVALTSFGDLERKIFWACAIRGDPVSLIQRQYGWSSKGITSTVRLMRERMTQALIEGGLLDDDIG